METPYHLAVKVERGYRGEHDVGPDNAVADSHSRCDHGRAPIVPLSANGSPATSNTTLSAIPATR